MSPSFSPSMFHAVSTNAAAIPSTPRTNRHRPGGVAARGRRAVLTLGFLIIAVVTAACGGGSDAASDAGAISGGGAGDTTGDTSDSGTASSTAGGGTAVGTDTSGGSASTVDAGAGSDTSGDIRLEDLNPEIESDVDLAMELIMDEETDTIDVSWDPASLLIDRAPVFDDALIDRFDPASDNFLQQLGVWSWGGESARYSPFGFGMSPGGSDLPMFIGTDDRSIDQVWAVPGGLWLLGHDGGTLMYADALATSPAEVRVEVPVADDAQKLQVHGTATMAAMLEQNGDGARLHGIDLTGAAVVWSVDLGPVNANLTWVDDEYVVVTDLGDTRTAESAERPANQMIAFNTVTGAEVGRSTLMPGVPRIMDGATVGLTARTGDALTTIVDPIPADQLYQQAGLWPDYAGEPMQMIRVSLPSMTPTGDTRPGEYRLDIGALSAGAGWIVYTDIDTTIVGDAGDLSTLAPLPLAVDIPGGYEVEVLGPLMIVVGSRDAYVIEIETGAEVAWSPGGGNHVGALSGS